MNDTHKPMQLKTNDNELNASYKLPETKRKWHLVAFSTDKKLPEGSAAMLLGNYLPDNRDQVGDFSVYEYESLEELLAQAKAQGAEEALTQKREEIEKLLVYIKKFPNLYAFETEGVKMEVLEKKEVLRILQPTNQKETT